MNSNELKNLREWVDANPVCQRKAEETYQTVREATERLGAKVSQGMALEAAKKAMCECGQALEEATGAEAYQNAKKQVPLIQHAIGVVKSEIAAAKAKKKSTTSMEADLANKMAHLKSVQDRIKRMEAAIHKGISESTLSEAAKKPGQPSIQTMYKWMEDGVAKATDGCRVEPDGVCKHGAKSWLLELGLI
jgi:chromosome segregation ATPase